MAPVVLVVEDEPSIQELIAIGLERNGHQVQRAANAEEALSIVEHSRPDIVLTDALMPKIDGRQLCRLIKGIDASIQVIVMSSLYTSSRYRVEALRTFHADEYLAKPINFDKLRRVLEKVSRRAA